MSSDELSSVNWNKLCTLDKPCRNTLGVYALIYFYFLLNLFNIFNLNFLRAQTVTYFQPILKIILRHHHIRKLALETSDLLSSHGVHYGYLKPNTPNDPAMCNTQTQASYMFEANRPANVKTIENPQCRLDICISILYMQITRQNFILYTWTRYFLIIVSFKN